MISIHDVAYHNQLGYVSVLFKTILEESFSKV